MYKKTAGHGGTLSLYLVLKPIYYTHLSNPVSSGDELVVLSVSVLFLPLACRKLEHTSAITRMADVERAFPPALSGIAIF